MFHIHAVEPNTDTVMLNNIAVQVEETADKFLLQRTAMSANERKAFFITLLTDGIAEHVSGPNDRGAYDVIMTRETTSS